MKYSTEEYLKGTLDLAMIAGSFALEYAKTLAAGGRSVSHAAAARKMGQKWESAKDHFKTGRRFQKEGE